MIRKVKRIHLTGKKAQELHYRCYERDNGSCIRCGRPIPYAEKHHHEPCGVYKSDEIEKVVMLCRDCHFKRHNDGKEGVAIRDACIDYLRELYGEKGAAKT